MEGVRRRLKRAPSLALLIASLALAARLLVPAGFMPMARGGRVLLVPCSGHGPMMMAMPMQRDPHRGHDGADHRDMPCGFAALADVATGGADFVLIAAALAHGMAQRAMPLPPSAHEARRRLRPPLRAPPA